MSHFVMYFIVMFDKIGFGLGWLIGISAIFTAVFLVMKLILEPIIEFRKTLADISNVLLKYQKEILNGKTNEEIHTAIAELATKLRSSAYLILFYSIFYRIKIFGLPKKENILLVCRKLNILSYGYIEEVETISEYKKKGKKILKDISKLLLIETTFEI